MYIRQHGIKPCKYNISSGNSLSFSDEFLLLAFTHKIGLFPVGLSINEADT